MSLLDYSFAADIAADGRTLLFDEEGEAGGANYTVYLRKSDRSPVVRLGEGNALALSPDGKWALSIIPLAELAVPAAARRAPASPADSRSRASAPSRRRRGCPTARASSSPAASRATGCGSTSRPSTGGKPSAITPEGITSALPGFRRLARRQVGRGDRPRPQGDALPRRRRRAARRSPASRDGEFPLRFSPDGRSLYVWKRGDVPARVSALDIETGQARDSGRTSCRPIPPASSGSPTSSSPPTARATPTATRGCCRTSSSSRA